MTETVLSSNRICKTYNKRPAVKSVNMCIRRGDIYGLVGENGAGKTTLMRMISGMSIPDAGDFQLFESTELDIQRRRMGVLIESPALFPHMTARENLIYFQILTGKRDLKQIDAVLETVGLGDCGRKKAHNYSLGMKQRLGIAIALLGQPEFLILDEPINGLDVAGVKEIRELLLKLNQEQGVTILISSHILSELSRVANRFGILRSGELREEFTAQELEIRVNGGLALSVSDTQAAIALLDGMAEISEMRQVGEGCLHLSCGDNCAAAVNRRLVEGGVDVSGLQPVREDLESYYLNQGGEQNG